MKLFSQSECISFSQSVLCQYESAHELPTNYPPSALKVLPLNVVSQCVTFKI